MNRFSSLPVSWLQSGHASERLGQFYDAVMSAGSVLTQEHNAVFSDLSICAMDARLGQSPTILFVGSQSSQRSVFGDDWADDPSHRGRTTDNRLEEDASAGYVLAQTGSPVYQIAETRVHGTHMTYERLILPIRLDHRKPPSLLAYMGYVLHRSDQ
ncbi:hypothetical protein [Coralliovum pocilloporae]|uniref:hypothetical protein n=1 Tax=Coralliovum pocilloporae TaxID=3066369 RepID=UPI003306FE22